MTKQEILQAVQRNIAGQGSMVDISGKLPEILSEILELASQGGGAVTHNLEILDDIFDATYNEALGCLSLDGQTPTVQDLIGLNPLTTIVTRKGNGTNTYAITYFYVEGTDIVKIYGGNSEFMFEIIFLGANAAAVNSQ